MSDSYKWFGHMKRINENWLKMKGSDNERYEAAIGMDR